jgi:hypothetical protein
MNTKMAVKEITSFFYSPASKLEALIKRKNIQDLYIPDLSKKREEDALAQQQDATDRLKAVFKRKKIEPRFSNVLNKCRDLEEQKTKDFLQERNTAKSRARELQQERMDKLAEQKNREKEAAKTLQNAFRNKKAINTFANRVVEKAIDDKKKKQ